MKTSSPSKRSTIFHIFCILSSLLVCIAIFDFIVSLVLVNSSLKRPADGWPTPEAEGSRADYKKEIDQAYTWLSQQQIQELTITSFDGFQLHGIYIPVKQNTSAKGTVLCFHGFHSSAAFEYAGFYEFFHNEGYNVVLPDMRTHGKSEGTYITFGVKERYDVQYWANHIASLQPDTPLWIVGVSLGCASVVMSTGTNLPKQIRGIIADCGFTSPYAIVKCVMQRDMHLPTSIIMPGATIFAKILAGFTLTEYSTLEALKTNTIPILFIHGKKDNYIPISMTLENYNACTAKKYLFETEAGHAANFLYNPEAYKKQVLDFFATTTSH